MRLMRLLVSQLWPALVPVLLLPTLALAAWTNTGGGDHGGADWTPAAGWRNRLAWLLGGRPAWAETYGPAAPARAR